VKKLLLYIVVLLAGTRCYAQSFTAANTGTIGVTSVLNVSLTNLTPSASFNTLNTYLTGLQLNNFCGVAVKGNVNWQLSISAQNQYFTPMSVGATATMPVSIVSFRQSGTMDFYTLSTNSQLLKTGSKGSTATIGNTFDVDMKFNPGLNYAGGIYTAGVLYTVTQQ
jgi:hypothetical protein